MPVKSENLLQMIFLKNEDAVRCQSSLLKLHRHLTKEIIITGSLATGCHLLGNNRQIKNKLNDIDIVVNDLSALLPSLSNDFLIRHFHPDREKGKILMMLVDKENKLRIDIFTPQTANLSKRSSFIEIVEMCWKIVSVEDLLGKLLGVIYQIIRSEIVEKKYFDHFKQLLPLADLNKAEKVWREYRMANQVFEFEEALEIIEQRVNADPNLLQSYIYSQDINEKCPWCVKSDFFPLAPLSEIYDILGYV